MSIALMTEVWRLAPSEISGTEAMVLLALADAADDRGRTWIAVQSRDDTGDKLDLCRKTKLSVRAVQTALKRLCADGRVQREDRPGRGTIWTVTPAGNAGVRSTDEVDAPETQSQPDAEPATPPQEVHPRRKCTPAGDAGAPAGDAGNPKLNPQLSSRAKALSETRARAKAGEPDSSGRNDGTLDLEGFEEAVGLYPASGLDVTDMAKARSVWPEAARAAGGPDRLVAAVRAYAADPVLKRRDFGAPSFQKWLSEGRWRHRLPDAGETRPGRLSWTGPADVRAAVEASGVSVASYLDPAGWDGGRRAILAAGRTAADRLSRDAGRALKALGVTVEVRISDNSSERVRA